MIGRTSKLTLIAATAAGSLLVACQGKDSEFREALPERQSVIVSVPAMAGSSGQGLSAAPAESAAPARIGFKRSYVVGQAAEWYTSTYYLSRDLNGLAVIFIDLIEAITKTTPSGLTADHAVWGPMSQPLEPNEYILNVDKMTDGGLHYVWKLEGKPKGQGDDAYIILAGGSSEPNTTAGQGKGWFAIEFDNIHKLNPTDKSHGRIEYAINKDGDGVLVYARYQGPADDGTPTEAFYAYGSDNHSNGYMLFAFQADLDNGKDGVATKEDVLIRTRWNSDGPGRADIFGTKGTLGNSVVVGSQCWGKTFVSTYESFTLDGQILAASGDASTCVFMEAKTPDKKELPTAIQTSNPHPFK